MEKKRWFIYGVQAHFLLIVWCFVPLAFAKSAVSTETKKGKVETVSKTKANAAAKKTINTTSRDRTSLKKKKTSGKALSYSSSATSRTTKGKKSVAGKSSRKTLRLVKSKKAGKATRAVATGKGFSLQTRGAFSARREAIARNYEGIDASAPYAPELAAFPIQVNNERLFYRVNSLFVLPGDSLTFSAGPPQRTNEYVLQMAHQVIQTAPNTWSWKAPQKVGLYPLKLQPPQGGTPMQVNVFVMAPFSSVEDGYLNGYRIGHYPTAASRSLSTHTLPRGFIEVTAENENTYVSPHFRLRQFLCKQDGDYPKYLALDARLLIVLEAILQKVNEQGHHSPTLSIMSGYRTPHYNRAIGNSTTYSRHLWGDAADIFVDAHPLDGEMDDLNRDNVVNVQDTAVLYDIVTELYEPRIKRFLSGGFFNGPILQQLIANDYADDARLQKLLTGGLARYRETQSRGPFVHVDVRGVFTRW